MSLVDVIQLSEKLCQIPVRAQLMYALNENFVGRSIDGYEPAVTNIALMTIKAAEKLCEVQNYLIQHHGYGLLIYDAYRPKRAVRDFLSWSKLPPANAFELERKAVHYPAIDKSQLFASGYLLEDSGHCYGNTVDLVLIDTRDGQVLEMGACFDYMDKLSHVAAASAQISITACENRQLLATAMQKFDFHPYQEEFWHFSHGGKAGREVDAPLDIVITAAMRGIGVNI